MTTAPAALVAEAVTSVRVAMVGGVVSTTVTLNVLVAVLLTGVAVSVAVQVTVVDPNGNVLPEARSHETVGVLAISVAVGLVYTTTAPAAPVASAVTSGGVDVKLGGVVSCTVNTKAVSADLLPPRSIAVQRISPWPTGMTTPLPDAGAQVTRSGEM